MSGDVPTETSGTAGGKPKSRLQRRIDDWMISPRALDNILNVLVAISVLCILLSIGFFTLSIKKHVVSIIVIPLLVYFALSAPGVKLRFRERLSFLFMSDCVAVADILLLCLYMDQLLYARDSDIYWKVIFCFIGIFGIMAYLSRGRYMVYLTLPFMVIYNVFFAGVYGLDPTLTLFLVLFLFMVFMCDMNGHRFYFGYGRVCIEGKYIHMPEEEAKILRKEQKAEMEEARKKRNERARATRASQGKKKV